MAPQLTRNAQIALKTETTEGTAEVLSASHAGMTVYSPTYSADIARQTRKPARGTLSKLAAVTGRQSAQIAFGVDLAGSGSVATAPSWASALKSCGFVQAAVSSIAIGAITGTQFVACERITGGTSGAIGRVVGEITATPVKYVPISGTFQSGEVITGSVSGSTATTSGTPTAAQGFEYLHDSSSPPSATIELRQDGMKYPIFGARGTVKIDAKSQDGSAMRANFEFSGVYDDPEAAALFTGVSYETVVPPSFKGVYANLHGNSLLSSAVFSNFSYDAGNTLTPRESARSDAGILSYFIGDRNPTGSIDPEMTSDIDVFATMKNGTTGRLALKVGSTAGNIVSISAPYVQFAKVGLQDRGGLVVSGLELDFTSPNPTGDDEIQIAVL